MPPSDNRRNRKRPARSRPASRGALISWWKCDSARLVGTGNRDHLTAATARASLACLPDANLTVQLTQLARKQKLRRRPHDFHLSHQATVGTAFQRIGSWRRLREFQKLADCKRDIVIQCSMFRSADEMSHPSVEARNEVALDLTGAHRGMVARYLRRVNTSEGHEQVRPSTDASSEPGMFR